MALVVAVRDASVHVHRASHRPVSTVAGESTTRPPASLSASLTPKERD